MRQDILLTDAYDLQIADGDFVVGGSAQQESEQITISNPGEWRQSPVMGFGIGNYLKKKTGGAPVVNDLNKFLTNLKTQLTMDGFVNPVVTATADLQTFEIDVPE